MFLERDVVLRLPVPLLDPLAPCVPLLVYRAIAASCRRVLWVFVVFDFHHSIVGVFSGSDLVEMIKGTYERVWDTPPEAFSAFESEFASCSTSISGRSGFGCWASSNSFADWRSLRAVSTGPKTLFFSLWLFFLIALDRELFAIFAAGGAFRKDPQPKVRSTESH